MVMDFEDGVSLSKMLKQGRRFNERSLWNILKPIAEGLERAHRVGVLHRDIKPPNILINEDNRPVLIDFGSARFEAAEATSTKVTFHTPPYAAIEQYVKTYPQGPWTDIYALGVVMYECVTGEKPPEVLERLHAGLGTPLASGKWPGYSKKFLSAIDAAMVVKPEDRPQSLSDWLAMFGKRPGTATDEPEDDEATRFYAQQVEKDEIVPVPPTPGLDPKAAVETGVPDDPKQARFKRMGEETGVSKKKAAAQPAAGDDESVPSRRRVVATTPEPEAEPVVAKAKPKDEPEVAEKKRPSMALMAGGASAFLVIAGIGGYMLRGGGPERGAATQDIQAVGANPASASPSTEAALDANVATTADGNAATPATPTPPGTEQTSATAELQSERAKAAAAQAQLAALRKAAAKSDQAKLGNTMAANLKKPGTKTTTAPVEEITQTPGTGVSAAKLSQFYSIVDDARSMAKKVMRSNNSQNAALAKSYDANLKTLRDSIRGVSSEREADRLIKQASQTRAYVQFLYRQQ